MILQGSFAVVAKSEAMIADTLAMSVDAFTYMFNLAAERLKHNPSILGNTEGLSSEEIKRRRKEFRLYLEFIPPLLSVTALIIVSIQTMIDAVHTLIQGPAEDEEDGDEPSVHLMLFFSGLNLGLDIMNVTCFAKAKNFSALPMGPLGIQIQYPEDDKQLLVEDENSTEKLSSKSENSNNNSRTDCDIELGMETDALLKKTFTEGTSNHNYGSGDSLVSTSDSKSDDEGLSVAESQNSNQQQKPCQQEIEKERENDKIEDFLEGTDDDSDLSEAPSEESANALNLNMCSAYTHVMADTMRSIAVLIAAGIAWRYKSIDPSTADASAAVVVSIIIALSLGPLLSALLRTFKEIVDIRREKAVARKDAQSSSDNQTIWLEEFQSLPHGIQN